MDFAQGRAVLSRFVLFEKSVRCLCSHTDCILMGGCVYASIAGLALFWNSKAAVPLVLSCLLTCCCFALCNKDLQLVRRWEIFCDVLSAVAASHRAQAAVLKLMNVCLERFSKMTSTWRAIYEPSSCPSYFTACLAEPWKWWVSAVYLFQWLFTAFNAVVRDFSSGLHSCINC